MRTIELFRFFEDKETLQAFNLVLWIEIHTTSKAVVDQLEIAGQVVAINATTYGEPEGLPEAAEGTYYIVSALTAQAAKDRTDLLIVDGTVRDADNRICGCTAFGRV